MRLLLLLTLLLLSNYITMAQTEYLSVAIRTGKGVVINDKMVTKPPYILTDTTAGTKYIINRKRTTIKAVDSNGKKMWKKDPQKSLGMSRFKNYRTNNPYIEYIKFSIDNETNKPSKLSIRYNNSQFGHVHLKDGTFHFEGQD